MSASGDWTLSQIRQRIGMDVNSAAMKRRFLTACCIFLLLFAQYGAVTHAIWHAHDALSHQETTACGDSCGDPEPAPELASVCAFDGAFCQVLAGAGAARGPLLDEGPATGSSARLHNAAVTARFLAPLSRGPPFLL